MAMYHEVFERTEKKYRISSRQRAAIERALEGRLAPDSYGRTLITSVYLDTPSRDLICRSLEKPLYKEKVRIRAYGVRSGDALLQLLARDAVALRPDRASIELVPGKPAYAEPAPEPAYAEPAPVELPFAGLSPLQSERVFFELKKKFDGVVYKRRMGMSLAAACVFLEGASFEEACSCYPLARDERCGESPVADTSTPAAPAAPMTQAAPAAPKLSPRSQQIAREIRAMLSRSGNPQPSLAIQCERVAWASLDEAAPHLRVTFDDALTYSEQPGCAHPTIDADESIMEIKNSGPFPLWLSRALASERVYPQSFSKCGYAHQLSRGKEAARFGEGVPPGLSVRREAQSSGE